MFCPNCGYEMFCPCDNCIDDVPDGMMPHGWTEDGNGIICANCELTASADWWEELEIDVVLKVNKVTSLDELAEKIAVEEKRGEQPTETPG